MSHQEIIDQITRYIFQSITYKSEIESNKLEFKSKWYNLKSDQVFQCARHISGIANSLGGGSGFLVFGYHPTDQTFTSSKLSDSGLNDSSEIHGSINRRINDSISFEIVDFIYDNKHPISVIHIQPSLTKPHILPFYKDKTGKESRHITFIRNGTKTDLATKEDFERMYMDRTNIFIDHKLQLSLDKSTLDIKLIPLDQTAKTLYLKANIHVENLGTRPMALSNIEIVSSGMSSNIVYPSINKRNILKGSIENLSKATFNTSLILNPKEIKEARIFLTCRVLFNAFYQHELSGINELLEANSAEFQIENVRVFLNTGKEIIPDLSIV